ncbi:hypothetical protein WA158_003370 [Blastocystis sp. Blastoise]
MDIAISSQVKSSVEPIRVPSGFSFEALQAKNVSLSLPSLKTKSTTNKPIIMSLNKSNLTTSKPISLSFPASTKRAIPSLGFNTTRPKIASIFMKPTNTSHSNNTKSISSSHQSSISEESNNRGNKSQSADDDIDPLDAYMKEINAEASRSVQEAKAKEEAEYQEKRRKEDEEEKENKKEEEKENKVITYEDIVKSMTHQVESTEMENTDDEENEQYLKEFREALKKQREEEEKKIQDEKLKQKIQSDLGFAEKDDDVIVDEIEGIEPTALDLFQKKMQKKVITPVDHSQMHYISIRKDFFIIPPAVKNMNKEEIDNVRESWKMKIRGKDYPPPIFSWVQTGLNEKMLFLINKYKYEKPFPIQSQAIPTIMTGRDVIAVARTGSGKTLAYLLPMFRHILDQPKLMEGEGPIAIIMAPARELVTQIAKEANKFAKLLNLRVTSVYGGSVVSEQINAMKRGTDIVVCTPGRMIDILCMNSGRLLSLSRVSFVVLDEADRMLDMGFEPQISMILNNIRPDRQLVMFSATFPTHVEKMAIDMLKKPIMIMIGGRAEVAGEVDQYVEVIRKENKWLRLLQLLGTWNTKGLILIFVDTQQKADQLSCDLKRNGYFTVALHGGMDQLDRDQAISDFKNQISTIMVATSVAGRGLDVKNLVLVINYDCPNHLEDYVHRVGRTGRAGEIGTAFTFITPEEDRYAKDLVTALRKSTLPVPEELQALADNFEMKVKAGEAKRRISGYITKGYKFTEEEIGASELDKNMQRRQFEIEGGLITEQQALDEEQEENDIRSKLHLQLYKPQDISAFTEINTSPRPTSPSSPRATSPSSSPHPISPTTQTSPHPTTDFGSLPKSVVEAAKAAESVGLTIDASSKKNEELTPLELAQKRAEELKKTGFIAAAKDANKEVISAAMKAVQALNMKIKKVDGIQKHIVNDKVLYQWDVEINDYPQKARQRITTRTEMERIMEDTHTSLTLRGTYIQPGKVALLGQVKLYLAVEGENPICVQEGRNEVIRILEEVTRETGFDEQVYGKYQVA